MQQGWRIAALTSTPKQEPIVASVADGRLNLAAEQPSDVVNMADPDTGATLLVGTQHRPGQGVRLEPAQRGIHSAANVARGGGRSTFGRDRAQADADRVQPVRARSRPRAVSPERRHGGADRRGASDAAAEFLRRMPADALLRLAITQLDDAANGPPLAAGPKHRAAAETFLALGLSAEAESLLHMASDQDPKEAASPDTKALSAIAALLAGRPDESGGLMDPKLDGTDEIALWRAVRQAMQDEGSPRAAAVFATTAPLVLQYPEPIRDHILPLMAETMIQGGEIEPAASLAGPVARTIRSWPMRARCCSRPRATATRR